MIKCSFRIIIEVFIKNLFFSEINCQSLFFTINFFLLILISLTVQYSFSCCTVVYFTGEIIRDANGLAVSAKCGEPGELCGKIRTDALRQFDGYLNKESTQKKIAHDVFSKGDSVFMTGDVLVQDEEGFFYFQDRLGDTFRYGFFSQIMNSLLSYHQLFHICCW